MKSPSKMMLQVSTSLDKQTSHTHGNRQEQLDSLPLGPRKYWEVSTHCDTLLLPQPRPEIAFDNPAANCHYQRLAASGTPDPHMRKLITQAHYRALAKLNQSQLQVRNFILPVELMKMKNMDPFSRQRVIEELCKYFSFQQGLQNVVLEQAELKFEDLCRLLVAIASSSKVKSLFLWHVLDKCDKPFKGPLQSDTVLDDLPRIPYTYNPGGRKYLRDLRNANSQKGECSEGSKEVLERGGTMITKSAIKSFISHTDASDSSRKISFENQVVIEDSNALLTKLGKLEDMVIKCLTSSSSGNMTCKIIRKEFVHPVVPTNKEHVFSQAEVGIQCTISQDFEEIEVLKDVSHINHMNADDSKNTLNDFHSQALKNTRIRFCGKYLKYYENTKINLDVLRDIYTITLNTLTNLTQLAVNYCMLADGTGNALMSIGSIAKGKLKHLKLLCEPEDIPSPTHLLYNNKALQAIPDLVWHSVEQDCPDLKVHIVCVSVSAYDITKRFMTKSMPVNSFHMENGFCPNFGAPQLTIFCTLKCLWLDHPETLEHVNLTLWHSTGRIDSSLVKLIQKCDLHSFAYHGPLQYKSSINKLCDAALDSPSMKNFKLMIQGDPCFPHIARELSSDLYNDYRHKFHDKSIHFALGTFNS